MSEWKECSLGDVLNLRRGHDLPHSEMKEGNVPVAGSNGIIGTHNIATDITPCITVGRSGSAGSTFIYERAWAHNTTLYVDDFKGNDAKYLYYLLLSLPLKKMAGGSAVPSLNRNHIHPLKIKFPNTINEQRRIASILSSLDDKIAVNRRICENLEAQAQALFKHWFIDFAPFKDGKFVESELGMIPEGWRVGTLGEICEYSKKKIAISSLNEKTYFSTENMLPNKAGADDSSSLPQTAMTTGCLPYDVLVSNIRPYFKKIIRVTVPCGCSTDVLCFHPHKPKYNSFLYRLLYDDKFFVYVMAGSKGTKMPRGDKNQIMKYPIIISTDSVLEEFTNFVEPMLESISSMKKENLRLSTLRDTLLPKLMSGQIKL